MDRRKQLERQIARTGDEWLRKNLRAELAALGEEAPYTYTVTVGDMPTDPNRTVTIKDEKP
jgi:hypothetical protein